MHRLFVAIRPPAPIGDQLLDTMEGFAALRWADADQLHVTLRFIGEVERPLAQDIAAVLATLRFDAFALRVAGVGRFDHQRRGALWARVAPREPVAALAAKVERACVQVGLPPERRAFHPHITLARWSRDAGGDPGAFVARHGGLASEPFRVDEFMLVESHLGRDGAHHDVIATYPAASG